VRFVVDGTFYEGESDEAINGTNVPCVVTVLAGVFSVTAKLVD